MTALDLHLDALAHERRCYAARIEAIAGERGREQEISGYLGMIDRLNEAAIRLARRETPGM